MGTKLLMAVTTSCGYHILPIQGDVTVGQIQSKLKVTISLVFVAQSTSHACQIYLGFLFWVTMELYTPKMTKMTSFLNTQFNHRAHASGTLVV